MRAKLLSVALPLAILSSVVAGCASTPKPTRLEAVVTVAANANPDRSGRPSPIVMWVFDLTSTTKFNAADYLSLADQSGSYLGGDVVSRREYQLGPGELLDISTDIDPRANYLGVVTAYRDLENSRWRDTSELRPNKRNKMEIYIDRLAVSIRPGR